MTDNLQALALQAQQLGYSVVPPKQDGSKAPIGAWKQYQTVPATTQQIETWYGDQTATGMGLITGQVSGNLEMLEFEGRAVEDGTWDSFCDDIKDAGIAKLWNRIAGGYKETTPSGGVHYLYRLNEGPVAGNTNLASKPEAAPHNSNARTVLIETRGEGGYTIIAPSNGTVHNTGDPWELVNGALDTVATITRSERDLIHAICKQQNVQQEEPPSNPSSSSASASASGHSSQSSHSDDRPGDVYDNDPHATNHTLTLLTNAGWTTSHTVADGTIHLTRPGKDPRDGTSATLNSPKTGGKFYCFTSNASPFDNDSTYSPFAVLTLLKHGGDFTAAAKQLSAQQNPTGTLITEGIEPWNTQSSTSESSSSQQESLQSDGNADRGIEFVDFHHLVSYDGQDENWLIEPLLPKGRQISVFAIGKSGKSLLTLDMALALATGEPIFGNQSREPISVLYIDYEMSYSDLQDRIFDFGYSAGHPQLDNLNKHLHYIQLQQLPPLDTEEGGLELQRIATQTGAEIVILDTFIRAVEGEENSADTINRFNRHTGLPIKRLGKTLLRIDHSGKDSSKGQRGTSAKRDDVDLIWLITAETASTSHGNTTTQLNVKQDASRINWVPSNLKITRHHQNENHPLHHTITKTIDAEGYVTGGIEDKAIRLTEILIPIYLELELEPQKVGRPRAKEILTEHYPNTKYAEKQLARAISWLKNEWDGKTLPTSLKDPENY